MTESEIVKKSSKHAKAGVTLSSSRVGKMLKRCNPDKRVGDRVSIYLAGAMENLAENLLTRAADHAHDHGSKRVNATDLIQAVRSDPDLARAFSGFAFTSLLPANKAIDHILPMGGKNGQRARRKRIKEQKEMMKAKKAAAKARNATSMVSG